MRDIQIHWLRRCFGAAVLLASLLPWSPVRAEDLKGFRLDGEQFTLKDGSGAVRGILVKPVGKGPFPAILISHGLGSSGEQFGRSKAKEFVKWGFVCIAPDYAHSDSKGDRKDFGASAENIRRAKKCLDILRSRAEVDPKRLCAYGNSMGAFLTIGLAAEEPEGLVAAAISAGGINALDGFPAPSQERAAKIKTPFCILHGTKDTTVPPERSALLEGVLKDNKVPYERHVFDGIGHDLHVSKAKEVNAKIEAWFRKYTTKVTSPPGAARSTRRERTALARLVVGRRRRRLRTFRAGRHSECRGGGDRTGGRGPVVDVPRRLRHFERRHAQAHLVSKTPEAFSAGSARHRGECRQRR